MYLRLLTTTDLHGHLVSHDYIKGQPTQGNSLAGLSRLIKETRAQAETAQMPVLLLDNGDTFQGTPLASYLAECDVTPNHPIIASLNHLRYDALGVGNHDLDHGMPYLRAVAQALDMPLLCSNLISPHVAPLRRYALLSVPLPENAPAPLNVGVMSVLPEHTAVWQGHHLGHDERLEEPAQTIDTLAQTLRDEGADIIVVLAHMGVGHKNAVGSDMQAAQGILASGQIDALVLGHTHRRLPSPDYSERIGVDLDACTVGGVPAIMAGHAGSDLGVMDLKLAHTKEDGWQITGHECTLRPNSAAIMSDPVITRFAQKAHARVVAHLDEPLANTDHKLHTFFSLAAPAPTQHLTAQAQHAVIERALTGTPHAKLPLLATAPAHAAGGRDGLNNYVSIQTGKVLRRHIAGLNPFANQTIGVRITGAKLRAWLEHSALIFNELNQSNPRQMLTNTDVPAFQFDTIYGLTYQIDPTAKPYQRITALRHDDRPVAPEQEFILATSHFRASGGGGYAASPAHSVVARYEPALNDSMLETIASKHASPWGLNPPWRFAPDLGVGASFLSHPDALECLDDIAHLRPTLAGETADGFIKLAITL